MTRKLRAAVAQLGPIHLADSRVFTYDKLLLTTGAVPRTASTDRRSWA